LVLSLAHRLELHAFPTRRSSDLRYGQRDVHFFYSKKSKQLFCSIDFRHEASRFRIIPTIKGISSSGEFYGFMDAVNFKNEVDFIDRKSTRLNSSHVSISYAVFCW